MPIGTATAGWDSPNCSPMSPNRFGRPSLSKRRRCGASARKATCISRGAGSVALPRLRCPRPSRRPSPARCRWCGTAPPTSYGIGCAARTSGKRSPRGMRSARWSRMTAARWPSPRKRRWRPPPCESALRRWNSSPSVTTPKGNCFSMGRRSRCVPLRRAMSRGCTSSRTDQGYE